MPGTTELPLPEVDAEAETQSTREPEFVVIVWDDPVNLMPYVTHVFQQLHEAGSKVAVREYF